jgi:putative ABC transport system substrate-binding protein
MWGSAVGGIVTLLLGLLVAPLTAVVAQPREKVPRVGYLNPGSASNPLRQRRLEAFRHGLRALGYVEGQNITIESRWAEGQYERYPALAADLVRVPVDVIVTKGGAATKAAQHATRTIPIVMSVVIDPLGSGLVSSLAHPGGNVTGHSLMASDLVGKQLELLKEVVPTLARVALLWNPANPGHAPQLREAEAAARVLGVQLHMLEARVPQELDRAFAAMTRERADALLMLAEGVFTNQLSQIAELATQRRLPSIYGVTEYVEAGGLMVYTANFFDLERRAATYVDKILRGAKPGDLPVEQPTQFELVINLKTAQALGITIPPRLLFQADKVIQ